MDLAVLTGSTTWALASTGFTNPSYLSAPVGLAIASPSAGFDITNSAAVIVAFEGTYTGATVAHEQTFDQTGVTGWFSVQGSPTDGTASTSTGSDTGLAYVFPALGVRQRVKVTALSTGTLQARVGVSDATLAASASGGGGGPTADVNIATIGGSTVTKAAGAVAAGTIRTTLASDDPAVASLATLVSGFNLANIGGSTVTKGAGAVAAGTIRTTLASDDPAVAAIGTTNTSIGATNSSAAANPSATAGLNGVLKGFWTSFNTMLTAFATFGAVFAGRTVIYDSTGTALDYSSSSPVVGGSREYESVLASASAQILGATGAVGDILDGVLIIPATAAAGAVSVTDGNGTAMLIFAGGGTTALPTLAPIFVPFDSAACVNATTPGWKVTTGTNVTAIGFGNFT